jgi:hypothetical protein
VLTGHNRAPGEIRAKLLTKTTLFWQPLATHRTMPFSTTIQHFPPKVTTAENVKTISNATIA